VDRACAIKPTNDCYLNKLLSSGIHGNEKY